MLTTKALTAMLLAASEGNATKIHLYLKAGMFINEIGQSGKNVLNEYILDDEECSKGITMLLYAAGENIDHIRLN